MAGPTEPTYRANPTDKQQKDIEDAEFDSTIPVMDDDKTKNIGNPLGAGQNMVQGDEGQITYHDDKYGYDMSELVGRKRNGWTKWRGQ